MESAKREDSMPTGVNRGVKPEGTTVSIASKIMDTAHDNCVGCVLCQLACSWVKHGEFNPAKSFIDIQRNELREGHWKASFTEDCDVCGYCFSFCHFDAIHLQKTKTKK